jgi:predicted nuclease with TOPRIM domain
VIRSILQLWKIFARTWLKRPKSECEEHLQEAAEEETEAIEEEERRKQDTEER